MEFNANANNSSAVNLAIACSEPLDGNDSLFSITFQGQGSGNSALGVTLYHLNEGNSPCTAIDASITVTDCALDVDGSGLAPDAGTDGAYTVRHLFGLPPVPQSFRENDPTIPSDAVIGANIDAIGSMLDVDNRGGVDAGTDGVYTIRDLFGLPPVPQSFRENDPTIPSDAVIGANIDALCP